MTPVGRLGRAIAVLNASVHTHRERFMAPPARRGCLAELGGFLGKPTRADGDQAPVWTIEAETQRAPAAAAYRALR
jgi:hypothetical protein